MLGKLFEWKLISGLGTVRSLASDGQYLYLYTSRGLFKIGSGHGGTIKGHIYYCVPDFFHDDKGWLGFANVSNIILYMQCLQDKISFFANIFRVGCG